MPRVAGSQPCAFLVLLESIGSQPNLFSRTRPPLPSIRLESIASRSPGLDGNCHLNTFRTIAKHAHLRGPASCSGTDSRIDNVPSKPCSRTILISQGFASGWAGICSCPAVWFSKVWMHPCTMTYELRILSCHLQPLAPWNERDHDRGCAHNLSHMAVVANNIKITVALNGMSWSRPAFSMSLSQFLTAICRRIAPGYLRVPGSVAAARRFISLQNVALSPGRQSLSNRSDKS